MWARPPARPRRVLYAGAGWRSGYFHDGIKPAAAAPAGLRRVQTRLISSSRDATRSDPSFVVDGRSFGSALADIKT